MACLGQSGEFPIYSNGLIYSDTTMNQLEDIVDSLNIKFRSCEFDKTFYAKPQARAHFITLNQGNIKAAKKDLENNITFDAFFKKYPETAIKRDLLVLKYQYQDYEENQVVRFRSAILDEYVTFKNQPEYYTQQVNNSWVFQYYKGGKYSNESLSGFFFIEEFHKQELPDQYTQLVQYADCMIDTTAQIFTESAEEQISWYEDEEERIADDFIRYVHQVSRKPDYPLSDDYERYYDQIEAWDGTRILVVDSLFTHEPQFLKLLTASYEEVLAKGGSNNELEEYVARYLSPDKALALKRNRIVVGGCSQDQSPRIHAMNIAILSAETINWEIFLRAHLNILNDNFSRVSDASYAWADRQTYIRELEELDISISDLLIGISLRIDNPSGNHYYGHVGRIGRALSETKYANEIENQITDMIIDPSLDDYNRILMYYLMKNYIHHLTDENIKVEKTAALNVAALKLPTHIARRIFEENN